MSQLKPKITRYMRGNGGKQKNNKYGFVFLNIILKKRKE